jgi:hypothetical protein
MQPSQGQSVPTPIAGRIGPVGEAGGLESGQLQAIEAARQAQKPLRRGAVVATSSGILLLLGAGGSFLMAIFGIEHLIAAAVLGTLGFVELRGASGLRAGRRGAGRLLMWNQIAFGLLLVVYGSLGIWRTFATDPTTMGFSEQTAQFMEQNPDMGLGGMGQTIWLVMLTFYAGIVLFGVLCQGLMALYYAGKERRLRRWRAETPEWAAQLLERAA